ncbi:flavin reductase family protein [Magnetococcus sp. PR-3]|uniref:flavin reductase family protein n=1 Tax=Magnetococcus sp. PR-3 TaxID=3120355 RepID=UPI002FCDF92C
MYVDLSQQSPGAIYHLMTQTLIPRPIAWVLSEHENGRLNLAPFSYFTGIASDPPLLMLSVGKKADGSPKDSRLNILQRKHFTVHIPHPHQADLVEASAAPLQAGDSEIEQLNLSTVPMAQHTLPRLENCAIAYACTLYRADEIGTTPQALLFGQIHHIYLSDEIATQDAKGRIAVNAQQAEPLARLGAGFYMHPGTPFKATRD